jgi:1,2-diacylglycerol 3-beta-glucosyltransferase
LERLLLFSLVTLVWVAMILMEKVLPQFSAVLLLYSFLIVYIWLCQVAQIHQKRKQRKDPPPPADPTYLPKISVLVPAHNEENVIASTVRMLMTLDYPHYDLLVIDDRSTDATPRILADLKAAYPERFQYLIRPAGSTPGKSAVLNDGLRHVDGDVLAVFDADAKVAPDFLSLMVPFLADEATGGVQARKVIANAQENLLTQVQNYEYSLDAHFQCGRDSIRGAVELRGNGQLIKREALADVGGWNNNTVTDDLDLSSRLHLAGWDIRFAHRVIVREEGIAQFVPLLRQRRRWAEGSLTRYLEMANGLMAAESVPLRTKIDMVAWFVEFLLPLWLVSDFVFLGLLGLIGDIAPGHLISSMIILPMLSVFFTVALMVAIVRFNRPRWHQVITGALLTGLYMTWLWVPIVFWVMVKLLFQKERQLHWEKTHHTGLVEESVIASKPH